MTAMTRNLWRANGTPQALSAVVLFAGLIFSIALGTSPLVAICAVVILAILIALAPRMQSLAVALAVVFIGQNFGLAIIIRLLTLRDLDGDLTHPLTSYACAAFLSIILGAAVVFLPRTRRWELPLIQSVLVAEWVAVISLLWGLTAISASILFSGNFAGAREAVAGAGMFNKHIVFICVPVVVYFIDKRFQKSPVVATAAAVAVCVVAGLTILLNQRKVGFDVCLAALVARLASGRPLGAVRATAAVIALAIFFGYLSPLISYMRFDIGRVTLSERPTFILENMPRYHNDVITGRPLDQNLKAALSARYLDYAASGAVAQRINGIQIVDFAVGLQRVGYTAEDPMLFGVRQSLPSVLSPDKKRFGLGGLFTWHAGLRPVGTVGYPFVNSPASAIWGYGAVLGVMLSAFLLTLICLGSSLFSNRLGGSVFGVILFVGLYNAVAEGDLAKHIDLLTRSLPEIALAAFLILWAARAFGSFVDVYVRKRPIYRPAPPG